jgi:hypothetical protein
MDLPALQALSVDKISEKLDDLTVEQLTELRALEAADASRKTLLEKIDAKLADAAEQQVAPAAAPAAAAVEPDYLADDYTGPLTVDQAQARLAKARAAADAAG